MITVIEVEKNQNESNMSLIRRFSRKVRDSGIVQKVKSKRFNQRQPSKLKVKESTLKHLEREKEKEKMFKLGKAIKGGRRRR